MRKSEAIFAQEKRRAGKFITVRDNHAEKDRDFPRLLRKSLPSCKLFAKIAALFHKLKSAIFLFPSRYTELFNCDFLWALLKIADFNFDRSACGY